MQGQIMWSAALVQKAILPRKSCFCKSSYEPVKFRYKKVTYKISDVN